MTVVKKHPDVIAWQKWKASVPDTFAGTASRQYLENRLWPAFMAGRKQRRQMSECTGPFSDARDCPVHSKDVTGKLFTEAEVREIVAKFVDESAAACSPYKSPAATKRDIQCLARDIRSGKENLE